MSQMVALTCWATSPVPTTWILILVFFSYYCLFGRLEYHILKHIKMRTRGLAHKCSVLHNELISQKKNFHSSATTFPLVLLTNRAQNSQGILLFIQWIVPGTNCVWAMHNEIMCSNKWYFRGSFANCYWGLYKT